MMLDQCDRCGPGAPAMDIPPALDKGCKVVHFYRRVKGFPSQDTPMPKYLHSSRAVDSTAKIWSQEEQCM